MHQPRLLLLGFGALNRQVAARLHDRFDILAVSRTPQQPEGVAHYALDLEQDALDDLPDDIDVAIYCLTPSAFTPEGYEAVYVKSLQRVLERLRSSSIRRLLFVSSTSVYGQENDEWVDEDSVTEPSGFSGATLLKAESLLADSDIATTVVRFSGIYGAGRTRLLQQALDGQVALSGPSGYTNRIHEQDAVGVLCHLTELAADKPLQSCYLASDCEPVRMHEVAQWIREQACSRVECAPEAAPAQQKRRAGSKRCANQRLRASGFHFRYPTFREGYGEMIEAYIAESGRENSKE
ncbi:Nucleoside-diphosphate-sugar epimerase [Hahella chejuensis KCTC 2396]|uniref:Nucleoside-diphosphate-sugar epimerase n=1 Tax=Hahella chejuensis (strain KCTC 2396) TaxID=349521 RepID=Q2S8R6_HAHCH|nr:sugar nucleotide-binding protein [Hahella chejuensis]ABC32958.1 Nucleoside-diphosphate-sugar epimerase [Hahella chejuensis KCTC 2396]